VQRLISGGLATRAPSDDDGRVVMVSVTPQGTALHAQVDRRRAMLLAHMLGAFSEAERPVLADMLERFVGAVDDFVTHLDQA
jgi:DNA-binding MarR family transcriptional regulator